MARKNKNWFKKANNELIESIDIVKKELMEIIEIKEMNVNIQVKLENRGKQIEKWEG